MEKCFVPPEGGIDWTVASFLRQELLRSVSKAGFWYEATSWSMAEKIRKGAPRQPVHSYRLQTPDAGESLFLDEQQALYANNSTASSGTGVVRSYKDVFHDLWRTFFRPSPRLAKVLNATLEEHGLVPGGYAAAHLRNHYGKRTHRDLSETIDLAALGINCASNLLPGAPVVFASDSASAFASARAYGRLHGLPIATPGFRETKPTNSNTTTKNETNDPIHLDKDPDWKKRPAHAYDPTFVDLYLLAESRCVAFSNGGYGTFGSMLSHDPTCQMRFFKGRKKVRHCQWMDPDGTRRPLELPPNASVSVGVSGAVA
mmetsp:Transcript_17890/g.49553  ORF Transcript_17890/g.49553 Transcript_17890/m.49553 type:complete len:315 (-) Transcript_17890:51-995(-)